MRLKKVKLKNFRLFSDLELDIPNSNLVVLVGSNGAGKTSLLDAIALCFTYFTGFLLSKSEDYNYNIESWFNADDVTQGCEVGEVAIDFLYEMQHDTIHNEDVRKISIIKDINVFGLRYEKEPMKFLSEIKRQLSMGSINSIPVIAYYNVNRTCTNNSPKKTSSSLYNDKLIAYERALSIDSPQFASFEDWFIKQENIENALKVEKQDLTLEMPSLKNVKSAFNHFFSIIEPEVFSNLTVKRESNVKSDFSEEVKEHLSISKNNISMKFKQFSYGERMIIGLVCEIARRLTIANGNNANSLHGEGVVLVDELDLHLHPNWQRSIIKALKTVFPKIQFIFSSHSPLILSGLKKENILILNNGEVIPNEELPDIYSGTADEILEKLLFSENSIQDFTTEKREIDNLFNLMKFDKAEQKLNELKAKVESSPQWLKDYEQRIEFAKL